MNNLLHGDCLEVLKSMPDCSVDSIVTDPPYGLAFMGKKWDYDVPSVAIWQEGLRVLKPGGHLLAFGGTRTFHRTVVAIEDAGFEIRDMIAWIHGQGFPKSLDVSKAIDKEAGAEREVTGRRIKAGEITSGRMHAGANEAGTKTVIEYTAPATEAAKQWEGWGTAMKPSIEPICMARKPISEKTVAKNVQRWGTGALNINGGRIPTTDKLSGGGCKAETISENLHEGWDRPWMHDPIKRAAHAQNASANVAKAEELGRFPANTIFDEEAARALDEMSGITRSPNRVTRGVGAKGYEGGVLGRQENIPCFGDTGGASRFFFCAKPSPKERGEGNGHPTVKPIALMRYLCRLVTPPGGTVLDPFVGSGTTGIAALQEGFGFIGIEREAEYIEIAKRRLENA